MNDGGAAVSEGESGDPAVVFVGNELIQTAVSISRSVSTAYLRENRELLTEALNKALADQRLEQFVIEFHEQGCGTRAMIVCDVTYADCELPLDSAGVEQSMDGSDSSVTMHQAPIDRIMGALPEFPSEAEIVTVVWPVVRGLDCFETVSISLEDVGSFGMKPIDVRAGVYVP